MTRARRAAILGFLASTAGALACDKLDLGQVPFYCNNGEPRCPEGYTCDDTSGLKLGRCIKQGTTLPAVDAASAKETHLHAEATVSPDRAVTMPDQNVTDSNPVLWDAGPPDQSLIKNDKGPPGDVYLIGCTGNADCASSSYKCCCPVIAGIWACLPLCLNPFCI
jgi:hypothetical protein